jgi:hypothetical protein
MNTTIDSLDEIEKPKLPLRRIIALSYSTYFDHFGDVWRISWLWLLLVLPLAIATSWLQTAWLAQVITDMASGPHTLTRTAGFALVGNITSLVFTFAGVSIAVAWHRRLLLDEAPGWSGSNVATGSMWRYICVGIAIGLIVMLPVAAILVPTLFWLGPLLAGTGHGPPSPAIFLLVFVIYIAAFAALLRLTPLLPARAIGDRTLTFRQVWNRTRGNIWRIFWGLTACSTPPLIALQIIFVVLTGFPNPLDIASGEHFVKWAATGIVFTCGNLLLVPIWIGFLSHAYRHFFRSA